MAARSIIINNQIAALESFRSELEDILVEWDVPAATCMKLNLVMEEILSNIIFYGYPDEGEHQIIIKLEKTGTDLRFEIEDDAIAFDPLQAEAPDLSLPAEAREVGGLGIYIIRKFMDEVVYERKNDRNILRLRKSFI